jgi:ABC-type lipoprotein export system ATPase subunit
MKIERIRYKTIAELLQQYPYLQSFFEEQTLDVKGSENISMDEFLAKYEDEEEAENSAINKNSVLEAMASYISQMKSFLGEGDDVDYIEILAGTNKSGDSESFEKLVVNKSEVVCIVGPTGSGKSRLLADIEWVAQNDTPTSRTVLVNGEVGNIEWRFNSAKKLVAQLSQNMNFVMDLTAYEFVELHAQSRMIQNVDEIVKKILKQANKLAGEKFAPETPITSLSGGQSRALMIADTAYLSQSPIILIDEIENAGIDRKKALDLLIGKEKIVLMATHDPILALMGDKRIVIKNGGIDKIIETSVKEKSLLSKLENLDNIVQELRTKLRFGEIIEESDVDFF